jgi:hypothetical protein
VDVPGALARCEQLLTTLAVPVPFDVRELCRRVAADRGRDLVLFPLDTARAGVPSGLWVEMPHRDELYYDAMTSPAHQDLIVLHELGHMLFDHHPGGELAELVAAANPDVAGAARRMLRRDGYSDQEELEAETFATVVAQRYADQTRPASPAVDELAQRLQSTFEG